MKRNYKFTAIIDVDDVLFECIPLACRLEQKANPSFHISADKIDKWITPSTPEATLLKYFDDPEFFNQQRPYEGAVEFIRQLSKRLEIFIVTAVRPSIMGQRVEQILKFFPEIQPGNIIPASRKDIIFADFALDDGAHNVLASKATYPVLFRRPWNCHLTGILAINNYEEFLNLVDCIQNTYVNMDMDFSEPHILALVGGSGSGKTSIQNELITKGAYGKAKSTTTRLQRKGESPYAYNFIDEENFDLKKKGRDFAETTVYAGYQYGTEYMEIDAVLRTAKHCVMVIDINGAMALKMQYPTIIIYIKRSKDKLINTLIKRVEDGESNRLDTVNRIVSLDDERKNEKVCDFIVNNNGTIKQTVDEILSIFKS